MPSSGWPVTMTIASVNASVLLPTPPSAIVALTAPSR
jgi:hypothetical protein